MNDKILEEIRKDLELVLSIDPNRVPEDSEDPNGVSNLIELAYPGHVIVEKKLPPLEVKDALLLAAKEVFRSRGADTENFHWQMKVNASCDVTIKAYSRLSADSVYADGKKVLSPKQVNRYLEKETKERGGTPFSPSTSKEGNA